MTGFTTIAMDPPWTERGGGKIKRGADRHYGVMGKVEILKTVQETDKWQQRDTESCSLWMWATVNHLPDALWLMDALGAEYVTNAAWVKAEDMGERIVRLDEMDEIDARVVVPQAPGLGQRLRMCHEHLLFGRIGRVPVPAPADRMPSVIYAPRGKHSAKPAEAYSLIERHDRPGRRLEMFARNLRHGWEVWGDDIVIIPGRVSTVTVNTGGVEPLI